MFNLDIISIIESILIESKPTPRIQEISFGILANMAAVPKICEQLSRSPALLRSLVEIIMTCTDPAPISEALRFLSIILVHPGPSDDIDHHVSSQQPAAAATSAPSADDRDGSAAPLPPHAEVAAAREPPAAAGVVGAHSAGGCDLESVLDDDVLLNQARRALHPFRIKCPKPVPKHAPNPS